MALPTTIVSAGSCPGYHPPVQSSGSDFYAASSSGNQSVSVYKTSDPVGGSWSSVASWNLTSSGVSAVSCLATVQDGDILHIAAIGNSVLVYMDLDMSTDTQGSVEVVSDMSGAMTPPGSGVLWCSIAFRAGVTSDELVVAASGLPDSNMGSDYERVDFWHKDDSASSWTGPVSIDAGTATSSELQPQLVLGTNDKVHVYYTQVSSAQTVSSSGTVSGNSISTSNSLSAERTNGSTVGVLLGLSNPVSYTSGTKPIVVLAGVTASTQVRAYEAIEGLGSIMGFIDNINSLEGSNDPDLSTGLFIGSLAVDGDGVLHGLYSGGGASGADQDLYYISSDDNAATWSTSTEILDAVTVNYLSTTVYTRAGDPVLAYAYDDGGTLKYNEYSLSNTTNAAISSAATAALATAGESDAASALDSDAAASVTWVEASPTVTTAAFTSAATGTLAATGAATSGADLTTAATASLTADGVAINVAAAALEAAATAGLTTTGEATAATPWASSATAGLTATGESTSTTDWSAATAATVTFIGESTDEAASTTAAAGLFAAVGTSTAEADKDIGVVASVTWTGEASATNPAAVDSNATAAATFSTGSTAATDWTTATAATVTFAGESTSESDLMAATTFTFNGTTSGDAAAAYSQLSAASVTWSGETPTAAAWGATGAASATFGTITLLSGDTNIVAAAAVTAVSEVTAEADLSATGTASLAVVGIEVSAQSSADYTMPPLGVFTAVGGAVVSGTIACDAVAALATVGADAAATTHQDLGGQRRKVKRRRKLLEEIEEEDIILLTSALFTYMGQTDGY